jgi:hypothetical protein
MSYTVTTAGERMSYRINVSRTVRELNGEIGKAIESFRYLRKMQDYRQALRYLELLSGIRNAVLYLNVINENRRKKEEPDT